MKMQDNVLKTLAPQARICYDKMRICYDKMRICCYLVENSFRRFVCDIFSKLSLKSQILNLKLLGWDENLVTDSKIFRTSS